MDRYVVDHRLSCSRPFCTCIYIFQQLYEKHVIIIPGRSLINMIRYPKQLRLCVDSKYRYFIYRQINTTDTPILCKRISCCAQCQDGQVPVAHPEPESIRFFGVIFSKSCQVKAHQQREVDQQMDVKSGLVEPACLSDRKSGRGVIKLIVPSIFQTHSQYIYISNTPVQSAKAAARVMIDTSYNPWIFTGT